MVSFIFPFFWKYQLFFKIDPNWFISIINHLILILFWIFISMAFSVWIYLITGSAFTNCELDVLLWCRRLLWKVWHERLRRWFIKCFIVAGFASLRLEYFLFIKSWLSFCLPTFWNDCTSIKVLVFKESLVRSTYQIFILLAFVLFYRLHNCLLDLGSVYLLICFLFFHTSC